MCVRLMSLVRLWGALSRRSLHPSMRLGAFGGDELPVLFRYLFIHPLDVFAMWMTMSMVPVLPFFFAFLILSLPLDSSCVVA